MSTEQNIYLEIGHGELPSPLLNGFYWKGRSYIGVDNDPDVTEKAISNSASFFKSPRIEDSTIIPGPLFEDSKNFPNSLRFICGPGARTGLTDKSVSIVFISNVLGTTFSFFSHDLSSFSSLFEEVYRVLKPNGLLVVSECNTPPDLLEACGFIEARRFKAMKFALSGPKTRQSEILQNRNIRPMDWKKCYQLFKSVAPSFSDGSYILIFRPNV